MPKYLVQASSTGDGVEGLRQEGGSARQAIVERRVPASAGSSTRSTTRSAIPT
jgi:hypothetical protein